MPQREALQAAERARGAPPPDLVAKVEKLLASVELVDVRPCAMSASLVEGVPPGVPVAAVEASSVLRFVVDQGLYGSRFDFSFVLRGDSASDLLGTIEFSILLDYEVASDFTPDHEAADFVTSTTGYFAAFPYARELFQSLAGRLQFDPVVLGLLKRNSMTPGAINVLPRPTSQT